jgi:hypothetical protein
MNYRSGFRRLYVVSTVCWILLCTGYGVKASFDEPKTSLMLISSVFAAIAVIPAIVGYFVAFKVIPWIIGGFRGMQG